MAVSFEITDGLRSDNGMRAAVPPARTVSESEYLDWIWQQQDADKLRAEWVAGKTHVLPPDNFQHGLVRGWLAGALSEFVHYHELGTVIGCNYMIRMETIPSRRMPDLVFVSREREHLVAEYEFDGPPDLAVEIVSRDSQSRDRREKFGEYEAAGVREYWVVDPLSQTVEVYVLTPAGRYEAVSPREGESEAVSDVLPGFRIPLDWFWQNPLPRGKAVRAHLGIEN
jgi:Uma2 family endonuclease